LAEQVAASNLQGVYVDANAISPKTARMIETLIRATGCAFVDAGIIGGPPGPEEAHLYLSGEGAPAIALLFAGADHLTTTLLDGPAGTASALKMCYAAWTKGSTALLVAALAAADALGVDQALREEWQVSQPELAERLERTVQSTPRKAWRFVAEMEQIADTLEAAKVPAGFHRAAAEIYSRLARFQGRTPGPSLEELLRAARQRDSRAAIEDTD
jgi:3-hydroxyisobutyrate dehydrogenase-like beta-hydroxyacid dehydrogenase